MDNLSRLALWNVASVVAKLGPGQSISRDDLITALRTDRDFLPSDAEIRHAFRHYVLNQGVRNAEQVVTVLEAAKLSGKTVAAIRQAQYRRRLVSLTIYRNGLLRSGVTLISLSNWCKWDAATLEAAVQSLSSTAPVDAHGVSLR